MKLPRDTELSATGPPEEHFLNNHFETQAYEVFL